MQPDATQRDASGFQLVRFGQSKAHALVFTHTFTWLKIAPQLKPPRLIQHPNPVVALQIVKPAVEPALREQFAVCSLFG